MSLNFLHHRTEQLQAWLSMLTSSLRLSCCGLWLIACRPTNPEPPSFLLVTLDTTRADHLPPYGSKAIMPIYSQLAKEGMVFERAYSPYPLTIPSHATIMTGKTPLTHGVRDNGEFILGPSAYTLAERLQDVGYHTAAFTAAFPTQAHWGFGQGFAQYHDPLEQLPSLRDWRDERRAEQVIDDMIELLEIGDKPCFTWVHLFDAHWPYAPPSPWAELYNDDPYLGEIVYTASQVERLVTWWDQQFPHSVIIITADHGEGLGDGGEQTHGYLLHDGTLHVPLIMRGQGISQGVRESSPVGLVDIAPTILQLAALPIPDDMEGKDLLQGGSDWIYSESLLGQRSLGLAPLYAHTHQQGRLTQGSFDAYYAYDATVSHQPTKQPVMVPSPQQQLESLLLNNQNPDSTTTLLDPQTLKRLAALGYMGGISPTTSNNIDPRDVIDIIPYTWQIRQAISRHDLHTAQNLLEKLQLRMPNTHGVHLLEGSLLQKQGLLQQALTVYQNLYVDAPHSTIAMQIAELYQQLGEWPSALTWYEEAHQLYPNHARIMEGMVIAMLHLGEQTRAFLMAEEFLAVHPDHEALALIRAEMLLLENRFSESHTEAYRALQRSPFSATAYRTYARTLWAMGRSDEAIDALQESLRLNPYAFEVRSLLCSWLMELHRHAEAVRIIAPAARLFPEQQHFQHLFQLAKHNLKQQKETPYGFTK